MKRSKMYVKAAKLVSRLMFTCDAINQLKTTKKTKHLLTKRLKQVFKSEKNRNLAWFSFKDDGSKDDEYTSFTDLGYLNRELALLFMAEIEKDRGN